MQGLTDQLDTTSKELRKSAALLLQHDYINESSRVLWVAVGLEGWAAQMRDKGKKRDSAKCGDPHMVDSEKMRHCERPEGHTGRHGAVYCGKWRYWGRRLDNGNGSST